MKQNLQLCNDGHFPIAFTGVGVAKGLVHNEIECPLCKIQADLRVTKEYVETLRAKLADQWRE